MDCHTTHGVQRRVARVARGCKSRLCAAVSQNSWFTQYHSEAFPPLRAAVWFSLGYLVLEHCESAMGSQTDVLFAAAWRKLPGELSGALAQAGLDDACTLANYPRMDLGRLREKGVGADQLYESSGGAPAGAGMDITTAKGYDVASGGGSAGIVCISLPLYVFFLHLSLFLASLPLVVFLSSRVPCVRFQA